VSGGISSLDNRTSRACKPTVYNFHRQQRRSAIPSAQADRHLPTETGREGARRQRAPQGKLHARKEELQLPDKVARALLLRCHRMPTHAAQSHAEGIANLSGASEDTATVVLSACMGADVLDGTA